MAFMNPETYSGDYWEIDGNCGTDFIPFDVCPSERICVDATFTRNDSGSSLAQFEELAETVGDYTNNTEIYEISRKRGTLARLSAAGYLDCTEWMPVESEETAADELAELYGDESDDE